MRRKIWLPAILALVLVLAVAGAALAQARTHAGFAGRASNGSSRSLSPMIGRFGFGFGGFGGWMGRGNSTDEWTVFDATATALNLSPTALFDDLHAGQTLSQIAAAQEVALTAVQQSARSAAIQVRQNAINQMLSAGRITQAQATRMLQNLNKAATAKGRNGRGFAMPGFGLPGGMGNWTVFNAVAAALNLTPDGFFTDLHSGMSLAAIAKAQNVTLSSVQTAARNAAIQAAKNFIAQALVAGKITQAQANQMLQRLTQGWTGHFNGGARQWPRGGSRTSPQTAPSA